MTRSFSCFSLMALAVLTLTPPAMAQGRAYTLPAPSGVPDGSRLVLFGQGWGKTLPVQGGKVRLPGDLNAQAIFGNFRRLDGNWLDVGSLSGVPAGWGAVVKQGRCEGDRYTCDGVEAFLNKDTFALVAPIATERELSSFVVSVLGGQACLQLPPDSNSISFSGAGGSRPGLGLPTDGPKGLVNVGQLLRETIPVGVVDGGQGSAQVVTLTKVGGNRWCLPVQRGQVFQFAYKSNGSGQLQAWSTVGAARLRGAVLKLDGNAPAPVGPFAYQAQ